MGIISKLKRAFFPPRVPNYKEYVRLFRGRSGLEIGGPSKLFTKRGLIPLYPVIAELDGCNFSSETVWEGSIREGAHSYRYAKGRAPGTQYINDAVMLTGIEDASSDFVLSCHSLEHIANPLKALAEWVRVIRPGGHLLLVLPHKDGTFDHERPVTSLAHLEDDLRNGVTEHDLTHLDEILSLHDLAMDPPAGDQESFRQRSLKNYENRCLHHHVFDTELAVRVADRAGLSVLDVQTALPYHIIVLAEKPAVQKRPDNAPYLIPQTAYRRKSLFPTDRSMNA